MKYSFVYLRNNLNIHPLVDDENDVKVDDNFMIGQS